MVAELTAPNEALALASLTGAVVAGVIDIGGAISGSKSVGTVSHFAGWESPVHQKELQHGPYQPRTTCEQ